MRGGQWPRRIHDILKQAGPCQPVHDLLSDHGIGQDKPLVVKSPSYRASFARYTTPFLQKAGETRNFRTFRTVPGMEARVSPECTASRIGVLRIALVEIHATAKYERTRQMPMKSGTAIPDGLSLCRPRRGGGSPRTLERDIVSHCRFISRRFSDMTRRFSTVSSIS